LAFPITGIDGLCKTTKANKGVGFAMMNHIVLEMFCETVVCLPMECCITVRVQSQICLIRPR